MTRVEIENILYVVVHFGKAKRFSSILAKNGPNEMK